MKIHVKRIFDKAYIAQAKNPSDFIKAITSNLERELVTKLMNELGDHKLYAVQLSEPEFIEDLPEACWDQQSAYKQDLVCLKLVQCKNCRMAFPWCRRFRDEIDGDGFCPYGKEIENA